MAVNFTHEDFKDIIWGKRTAFSKFKAIRVLIDHDAAMRQHIAELEKGYEFYKDCSTGLTKKVVELEEEVRLWKAAAGAMPVDRLMEK